MWWRSRLRSVDRSLRSARFSAGILYDPRLLISSFNQFHIALFKTLSDCQQSKLSSGGRNCSNFAELRGCCSPFGPPLLSTPPPSLLISESSTFLHGWSTMGALRRYSSHHCILSQRNQPKRINRTFCSTIHLPISRLLLLPWLISGYLMLFVIDLGWSLFPSIVVSPLPPCKSGVCRN